MISEERAYRCMLLHMHDVHVPPDLLIYVYRRRANRDVISKASPPLEV